MTMRRLRQREERALLKPKPVYGKEVATPLERFCVDVDKAAAKVRARAGNRDELVRLIRLELITMGYSEFA